MLRSNHDPLAPRAPITTAADAVWAEDHGEVWPLIPGQAVSANRSARRLLALAVIRVLADARRGDSAWRVLRRLRATLEAFEERLPAVFRDLA